MSGKKSTTTTVSAFYKQWLCVLANVIITVISNSLYSEESVACIELVVVVVSRVANKLY